MPTTTWTDLLDGRPIASPFPLTPEATVALLDWLADLNHGPDGKGPENAGAAHALHILGHQLQNDETARAALVTLRAAVAHEDEAERRSPCATTAHAAAKALEELHQAIVDGTAVNDFYQVLFRVLPTPIHARYALSILVEEQDRFKVHLRPLFRGTSDRVFAHAESSPSEHEYVERIRGLLDL